jgi:hypothetical protein
MVFHCADEITMTAHGTGQGITINGRLHLQPQGEFTSTMAMTVSSDERIKTIVSNVEPKIEDIAGVRVVDFKYNNDDSNKIHTGSIAQDWQDIVPNAINKDADGMLSLDYDAVATVSAVTAAKEIVKLK